MGAKIEKFLDESPFCDWDFDFSRKPRNPNYSPPDNNDNGEWIIDLYRNILMTEVDENDEGYKHWMTSLKQGRSREEILKYFKEVAAKENLEIEKGSGVDWENLIDDDCEKRLVIVMPVSAGDVFMCTSLLQDIHETYPEYAIYFATETQNFSLLHGNPYIHKTIPYSPQMDDILFLEGKGSHKGYFDIAFMPHAGTQRFFNYQHNGEDRINLELCTS